MFAAPTTVHDGSHSCESAAGSKTISKANMLSCGWYPSNGFLFYMYSLFSRWNMPGACALGQSFSINHSHKVCGDLELGCS